MTTELKNIPMLQGLREDEMINLSSIVHRRSIKKGETVLHEHEPGDHMMFLVEGKAKVSLVGTDGKEVIIALLEDGEVFGELSLLTGEPRSADVVAQSDCTVFVLAKADFDQHFDRFAGFAKALLRSLAFRLRAASEKIGDLALFDVYRRVARVLRSLGEPQETAEGTVYLIAQRPTHQELAAMVGTSREMVTRALKGLEEDGCIVVEDRRITLKRIPR